MKMRYSIGLFVIVGFVPLLEGFPYQKPHRFTNHNYVSGQYQLKTISFINFPKKV